MRRILLLTAGLLWGSNLFSDEVQLLTADELAQAAMSRVDSDVRYDGRYVSIDYPNGDVPSQTGVCTDVIIRSYRILGIDLQQYVHEDMKENFSQYPSKRIWGLTRTDTNIDHRRVPNLQTFFTRHGESLEVTHDFDDYQAGDIVTWMLPGNRPHIGIVSAKREMDGHPLIVHNIGQGPKLERILFEYPISGHYRYLPTL